MEKYEITYKYILNRYPANTLNVVIDARGPLSLLAQMVPLQNDAVLYENKTLKL